jgi:hypothetical protein
VCIIRIDAVHVACPTTGRNRREIDGRNSTFLLVCAADMAAQHRGVE